MLFTYVFVAMNESFIQVKDNCLFILATLFYWQANHSLIKLLLIGHFWVLEGFQNF